MRISDWSSDVCSSDLAVNDTLKAIAASLLMEQVLAPRFNFSPKRADSGPAEGYDYGEGGYDPTRCNVGFNEQSGQFQIEIKGLAEPKRSEEHTSELQSLMRNSYAVICLKKKKTVRNHATKLHIKQIHHVT